MGATWDDNLSYSEFFGTWSGIHPNQNGYNLMAKAMYDVINPLVAQLLDFPTANLVSNTEIPGSLLLFWTVSPMYFSVVNVLNPSGGYWNGQPVEGQSYFPSQGTAGIGLVSLPAGNYNLEFCVFWEGAWRVIEVRSVTVIPAI